MSSKPKPSGGFTKITPKKKKTGGVTVEEAEENRKKYAAERARKEEAKKRKAAEKALRQQEETERFEKELKVIEQEGDEKVKRKEEARKQRIAEERERNRRLEEKRKQGFQKISPKARSKTSADAEKDRQRLRRLEEEKLKKEEHLQTADEKDEDEQKRLAAAENKRKKAADEARRRKQLKESSEMRRRAAEAAAAKEKERCRLLAKKKKEAEAAVRRQFEANKRRNAAGGPEGLVRHVPKRSALLARGGPEAEAYKKLLEEEELALWRSQAGDRWSFIPGESFALLSSSETKVEEHVHAQSIEEAIERFQNNPHKYIAMYYPQNMTDEDVERRPFSFVLRQGTTKFEPLDIRTDGSGRYALYRHAYRRLEPLRANILPPAYRDKYTDSFSFEGKKLHGKQKPALPGRGMGIGDTPSMKFIGDYAEPADIFQGNVGDCWLLSAIACLADFDFAIRRLFRKTQQRLKDLPLDHPNQYTVTLWDLSTWKEVDIVVDERLPVQADESGSSLLGAKPAKNGKIWVPYLEKAIAAHCGGYDKLLGGNCTNAWPMLTGSRNQFVITRNRRTGKYECGARYNPMEQNWSTHSNSPHNYDQACWKVEWPPVGGGGASDLSLTPADLFRRIVIWDKNNYLIGAGTDGQSDKESTDGIVDNHAYSVIDSEQNICGSGIDLLLIRNPWGEGGELKNGQFMRNGLGWKRNPNIYKELQPTAEDNGLCWVTKEEFFRYFPTIYLCALDITRLEDPQYKNDLKDHFPRLEAKKSQPASVEELEPLEPIIIDTSSDPKSRYKIIEQSFDGGLSYNEMNKDVVKGTSIVKGVEKFKKNPDKYLAIHWQKSICSQGWPAEVHQFTFVYRHGTDGLQVEDRGKAGKRTILTNVLR